VTNVRKFKKENRENVHRKNNIFGNKLEKKRRGNRDGGGTLKKKSFSVEKKIKKEGGKSRGGRGFG